MNIYNALKKENMDLDEMLFAEEDLRSTLKEAQVSAKCIGRLINILRHYQPSIVYKNSCIYSPKISNEHGGTTIPI